MQKKGLSTIIITLILIVVSLVAVAIFWVVVRNLLQTGTEGIGLGRYTLSGNIKNVALDNSTNNVSLTVERNPGQGEINGIEFIFSDGTDSEVVKETISMKELESRKFYFHLTKLNVSNLVSISIAFLIKQDNTEILGDVVDKYNVGEGGSGGGTSGGTCSPATCSSLGYSCGNWANGTCSGTLNCGACPTGQSCNANGICQTGTCSPTTCSALGYQCGSGYANGTCSGTLNCGNCSSGYSCNASSKCVVNSCVPATNPCGTAVCGNVANGTCGQISCGTCSGGQSCVSGICQATGGLCTGLKLLMHFDSSTSPTPDSSGNGNDGTVTGATWISSGKFGGAFHYDGINDYLGLSSSPLTSFSQSSICMWVNIENITWTGGSYSQTFLNLYVDSSNSLRMGNNENSLGGAVYAAYAYSGTEYGRATAAGALSSNSWRHICYTFNSTHFDVYVENVLSDTATNTFARGTYNLIGSRATVSGFTNGTIDDLAIWGRSLTADEISNIYSSGSAINC